MAEEQKHLFQTRLLLHKTGKSANDRLLFGRPISLSNRTKSISEHLFNSGKYLVLCAGAEMDMARKPGVFVWLRRVCRESV